MWEISPLTGLLGHCAEHYSRTRFTYRGLIMPIPAPKGGPTRIGADSTAGKRGFPARRKPEGGPKSLPGPIAPPGEPIGTNVRGGPTSGKFYERPLSRRTPESGDGTGQ